MFKTSSYWEFSVPIAPPNLPFPTRSQNIYPADFFIFIIVSLQNAFCRHRLRGWGQVRQGRDMQGTRKRQLLACLLRWGRDCYPVKIITPSSKCTWIYVALKTGDTLSPRLCKQSSQGHCSLGQHLVCEHKEPQTYTSTSQKSQASLCMLDPTIRADRQTSRARWSTTPARALSFLFRERDPISGPSRISTLGHGYKHLWHLRAHIHAQACAPSCSHAAQTDTHRGGGAGIKDVPHQCPG